MPPELAEVREWLRKADNDRRMAKAGLLLVPPITEAAAFHCQQAVEKLLKAFLIWREEEFEKTHDLRSLIERCGSHDPAFLDHQDTVEPLTAYAIRFRYPGPEDPSTDEVSAALDVVEQVWDFVLARVPDEARP